MLTPGTTPGPPTKPAPIFEVMFPYKLGITKTSNCWGLETSYIEISIVRVVMMKSATYLHSSVINDHVVEANTSVRTSYSLGGVQEKAITKFPVWRWAWIGQLRCWSNLHDVGFVHASDFLSSILDSKVKGKFSNSFRLELCHHFERLHYSRIRLPFTQHAVWIVSLWYLPDALVPSIHLRCFLVLWQSLCWRVVIWHQVCFWWKQLMRRYPSPFALRRWGMVHLSVVRIESLGTS